LITEPTTQMPRDAFGLSRSSTRDVVCVQGLGFVGAAMAAAIAAAKDERGAPRFDVIGIELDNPQGRARASCINAGAFPFESPDPLIADAVGSAHRAGNLVATTDDAAFRLARVAVVDVNLDIANDANGEPAADLRGFEAAIRTLGRELPPGALVVVETTVPPGTCSNVVAPVLADELKARGLAADALMLAHSYERVMPGPDYFDSIVNFWRVYAGQTEQAAERCEQFLSRIVNVDRFPLRRLSSMTASEIAKVLENSYRAVNIAFIEEWARLAEAAGVDLFEVVAAIRDRPTHNNIRQPGFGVGGYCLPKDPLFAPAAAKTFLKGSHISFPFCRMAVEINQRMPLENLNRVEQFLGPLQGKSLALLGVAYRSEVDDTRSAPSEIFYREAKNRGATLTVHDPYVRRWSELDLPVARDLPDPSTADVVVFAVPHFAYRELDVLSWLDGARPLIYDCDNVLSAKTRAALRSAGVCVESTGRGQGL
jgi:UDP-N-acetyl-D-glucosamine dehydrogenase